MSGVVIIAVALAVWVLYPAFQLQYQQEREKATLEQELAGLQERNETLLAQVERLKTPEGVEEAARERLGLAKAGERVYIVTEGEATRAPEPDVSLQAASVTVPEAALLTKALDFIFGVR
jgi:cell division protein FtsB